MRKHSRFLGKIFVISGPSGSGKTTLRDNLFKDRDLRKRLAKSVSLTTRKRRSGERNGRDYFFVTKDEFKRRLKAKKILEWTRYLGYYYATPRDLVEKQLEAGKSIALCLDLKGARHLSRFYPKNCVTIFILPPSLEALRKRIEGRCCMTKKEEVARRLMLATKELRACAGYSYSLVNENLTKAAKELKKIVLKELNKSTKAR